MNVKAKRFQSIFRIWVWVVVFAIAFAWVESAVVVYHREINFDMGYFVLCATAPGRSSHNTGIDCDSHGSGRLTNYLLR